LHRFFIETEYSLGKIVHTWNNNLQAIYGNQCIRRCPVIRFSYCLIILDLKSMCPNSFRAWVIIVLLTTLRGELSLAQDSAHLICLYDLN
jgi:hypothetical protein